MSDVSGPSRLAKALDSDFAYQFRSSPVAMVSSAVTLLLVLAAVFAPLIAPLDPFNPASLNLMNGFTPPSTPNQFTGDPACGSRCLWVFPLWPSRCCWVSHLA